MNRRLSFASARSATLLFVLALLIQLGLNSCASTEPPFHGFSSQADLDRSDAKVMKESVGGSMDPFKITLADQRYNHNGIAYNKEEEGFYQWGRMMYELGYRDIWYVRDIAPKAVRREALLDIYDKALQAGFSDAESASSK